MVDVSVANRGTRTGKQDLQKEKWQKPAGVAFADPGGIVSVGEEMGFHGSNYAVPPNFE
jgi:hypothetical protein